MHLGDGKTLTVTTGEKWGVAAKDDKWTTAPTEGLEKVKVLGPVGMLLSIPLTMVVKIALETRPQTRWIATLLDH